MRKVSSLGVAEPGRFAYYDLEQEPCAEGEFRVDTLYSGLSAGTELSFFKGTNPYLTSRWDPELGLFLDGDPSRTFPIHALGYMEVGRVAESKASSVRMGQIVAASYGHRTGHTLRASRDYFVILPENFPVVLGIYVAQMGPICANGLLHAAADVVGQDIRSLGDGVRGRNVVIMGAGVVGLLTGIFALGEGAAEVAFVDRSDNRLTAARALGAEPLDERNLDPWNWCKERWHHGPGDRGADLVFQCRARPEYLNAALRCLRPQGTVIDLAFYQEGAPELRLGHEFHHNGLSIRCAQIARVPRGTSTLWNQSRLSKETIRILRSHGELVQQHLITDVVPFERAGAFIAELARRERSAIQVVLDFTAGRGPRRSESA
jgi:threonine dehydrogenase-like Zn-dependent dehydrogenase